MRPAPLRLAEHVFEQAALLVEELGAALGALREAQLRVDERQGFPRATEEQQRAPRPLDGRQMIGQERMRAQVAVACASEIAERGLEQPSSLVLEPARAHPRRAALELAADGGEERLRGLHGASHRLGRALHEPALRGGREPGAVDRDCRPRIVVVDAGERGERCRRLRKRVRAQARNRHGLRQPHAARGFGGGAREIEARAARVGGEWHLRRRYRALPFFHARSRALRRGRR
nr:MAG: hypothetical protein DIU78_11560 [Pseudomonadota bacterium]